MESLGLYTGKWYLIPRGLFRLCFIFINNLYCIPTYVIWMLLLLPLKKLHPDSYWKIEGHIFHWLLAMVSMWSWSAGYDIVEVGDDISKCTNEKTLLLINHQSTGDVPLLMSCFNSKPDILPNIMWIMDKVFKYTNFGIVSTLHKDFFIVAGKESRQGTLEELAHHLTDAYIPLRRRWIILFPEGGFLRKRIATSQRYAEKNNLPLLNHVTLPRVGALQVIMRTIGPHGVANNNTTDNSHDHKTNELKYILDITVAYPNGDPLDIKSIVFGHREPCATIFFYRIYDTREVPQDGDGLTNWLYKRFEEKEKILDTFYKTGRIPVDEYRPNGPTPPPRLVTQDYLRYLILHIFFLTSTYVHYRMFLSAYGYYTSLMN